MVWHSVVWYGVCCGEMLWRLVLCYSVIWFCWVLCAVIWNGSYIAHHNVVLFGVWLCTIVCYGVVWCRMVRDMVWDDVMFWGEVTTTAVPRKHFNEADSDEVSSSLLKTLPNCEHFFTVADSTPKTTLLSNAVKITFTVGYAVCFLIGFTGNLLILVAIKNNKQLHNDINYLLCNVAITDILRMIVLISYEPFVIHVNGNPGIDIPALPGVPGDVVCKAMWTLPKLFVYVFTYTLVFMTVERFVAVVFPFSTSIFKRKSKCLITAIWTTSIVLSLPDLYATKSMMKNSKPVCETDFTPFSSSSGKAQWDAYLKALAVYVSTAYVIPLLIVLLLHVVMSCVLSRHRNDSLLTASNISSSTRRVVSMLGTMSVVFALTSIPIQLFHFSYICDAEWIITTLPVYVTFLLMFVSQLSSMFNPWIYPLYVKSFHNEYSKLLGKVFLVKKNRCESLSHDGTTVKRLTSWSDNTRPDVKETCI